MDLRGETESGSMMVLFWSTKDAQSRMVNAWMSRHTDGYQYLSICVDADTWTARQYAELDNIAPSARVIGANEHRHSLISRMDLKSGMKLFRLADGRIKTMVPVSDIWDSIAMVGS